MAETRSINAADADLGVSAEQLCRVLELAVADRPLAESLGELIKIVESTSKTGVLGSILLLDDDGRHLHTGAAPSLPELYCGDRRRRNRPLRRLVRYGGVHRQAGVRQRYRQRSLMGGICRVRRKVRTASLLVHPILTSGRKVLGTFAMYHREPREATLRDLAMVDLVTQTAALIIDRKGAQEASGGIANMAAR